MTKAAAVSQAYLLYAAFFVLSCYTSTVKGTNINIINRCSFPVTAYRLHGPSPLEIFPLPSGQNANVDIGQTPSNTIWASSSNNQNQGQATVLEITVNGAGGNDFYDISNVNAYNLPTKIQPSRPGCKAPSCTIANPRGFCQAPNVYGSAGGNYGEYCLNPAGPGRVQTAGTQAFKARCPDAYSYSLDDATSTFTCATGGNYDFIYCP